MNNERDKRDITPEKEYVSWSDIEQFVNNLKDYFTMSSFTGVYAPARGGLIFAVMISHRYGLPFLGAPQVGCLCVDDICDTGDTALAWKDKGYTIATMYYKEGSKVTPDYWMFEKKDKWIVFPFE